jgi:hypothetical protein
MVEQPCKRVQGSEEGRNISVEEEMKEVGHADQREARQGGEHGAVTADEVTSGEEMERQQNKKKMAHADAVAHNNRERERYCSK